MSASNGANRVTLQRVAKIELLKSNASVSHTKCEAFTRIVTAAVDINSEPKAVVNDLTAVLIGNGLTGADRGAGPHYIGNMLDISILKGAEGFKPKFRDESFQIHHAMAAIHIGFYYCFVGEWYARVLEHEEQDDALYRALCPIGDSLCHRQFHYTELPLRIHKVIADATSTKPPEHWQAPR